MNTRSSDTSNADPRQILDELGDAFIALDEAGHVTYVNGRAARLAGREPRELLGESLRAALPVLSETRLEAEVQHVQQLRAPVEFETRVEPLGQWLEVRVFAYAGGVGVHCRDVSSRHRGLELAGVLHDATTALSGVLDLPSCARILARCALDAVQARAVSVYRARSEGRHELLVEEGRPPAVEAVESRVGPPVETPTDRHAQGSDPVVLPLDRGGRVIGALIVHPGPGQLTAGDREFLRALADQGAQAFERTVLYEEVRHAEERYRSLVRATSQIVWSTDSAGEFVAPQPDWTAFTGQATAELLGWGWREAVHPDDRDATTRAWLRSLANREPYEVEHRVRDRHGDYRHMHARAVPVLERDGSVREWVGIHTDITERVRAETMLRGWTLALEERVEQRTRELGERNTELQAETEALKAFAAFTELVVSEVDPRVLAERSVALLVQTFGEGAAVFHEVDDGRWTVRAVAGTASLRDALGGEIAESAPFRAAIHSGAPVFVDGLVQPVDGLTVEGSVGFAPIRVQGELHGMLVAGLDALDRWRERERAIFRAVWRGLTLAAERALTTGQLLDQRAELQARATALEGFGLLARDLAFETDLMTIVSRAQEIVLGLLPPGFAVFFAPDGDRWRSVVRSGDVGHPALERLIDSGISEVTTASLTGPWTRGEALFMDRFEATDLGIDEAMVRHIGALAALPVVVSGRPHGVLAVALFGQHRWKPLDRAVLDTAVRHLSLALERAEVAASLEAQRAQLRAANEELESFSYSVSHDLRAPLRHIHGFSGILRRSLGSDLPEKAERALSVIEQSTDHMNRLIEELLAFSRLVRRDVSRRDVDLGALVGAVREELGSEVAGRDVEWVVGRLPTVQADPVLLRQVVTNLLSNAVKYTSKVERARIEIGARFEDGEHVVFVRDNGAGFDQDRAGRLFGVFQRLHHDREFEGLGVGLATVKRIVARHGGRVWAEGRRGEGATFSFTLPA